MRIMLLTKNFPPRTCGVGDYACRLAEELSAAGSFVTVLTEPADGPRHFPLGMLEVSLRGWRALRPALNAIAASSPERVQLEYSAYAWSRWGAAWWLNALLFRLRRRGIPVHVGLHEIAVSVRRHPLHAPAIVAQWLHVALILAAAETVALNMRSRAALLQRLFPWWSDKIRYRPNSSTIPVVPLTKIQREAFRSERGIVPGEIVVAAFGLFHPAKNYEGLIESVALLRRSVPARLWMLGNFAAASPLYIARLKQVARKAGVEDVVWWPGRLDSADVSRALQAVDIFVLPQPDGHLTRSSAFMAAAAHGLPVVAVRQPGGRDQAEFSHGENVWLVPRSTPQEIAAAIRALMNDRALSTRMSRNLSALYAERFDWNISAPAGRSDLGPSHPGVKSAPEQGATVVTATHVSGAKP